MKNIFAIEAYLTRSLGRDFERQDISRQKFLRQIALNVLNLAYHHRKPFNKTTFTNILYDIARTLSRSEQLLVTDLCLNATADYIQWREDLAQEPKQEQATGQKRRPGNSYVTSGWHGGAGSVGRLFMGYGAPSGAEAFQSDDDPRDGLKNMVRHLIARGAGTGYSLSELAGDKQPPEYSAGVPSEDLRRKSKTELLAIMDTATNPGDILRPVLIYYNKSLNIDIGNIRINANNINNPKNVKTASQLDSVYRHMKKIDGEGVMTPVRALRFLVLCHNLLLKADVKEPRGEDKKNWEIYKERSRELNAAKTEIADEMRDIAKQTGISVEDMERKIDSDKRSRFGGASIPVRSRPALF